MHLALAAADMFDNIPDDDVPGEAEMILNDTTGYLNFFEQTSTDDDENPHLTTHSPHNSTSRPVLPEYYGLWYKTIGCLLVSVIFVIGFFGNLMVIVVVGRTKSMHTTTNCYLVSLAVADILLLVAAPLPTIVEYFLIVDESIFGAVGCSIMVFSQYLGVNLSSLSITAFTVERYIAICHPMRAQTMCTVNRANRIICGLWAFGVLYCAPWLYLTTTRVKVFTDNRTQPIEECTFKLQRSSYLTYYMADFVIFYIVPLSVTCVLYGLIARILHAADGPLGPRVQEGGRGAKNAVGRDLKGGRRGFGGAGGGGGSREQWYRGGSSSISSSAANRANGSGRRAQQSVSSRIQVTKMLSVVVCVFAVLWLPYRAYVVYNSFARSRYENLWFLLFCRIMVYLNSAINPILYSAMSMNFRRAFRCLLRCPGLRSCRRGGLKTRPGSCRVEGVGDLEAVGVINLEGRANNWWRGAHSAASSSTYERGACDRARSQQPPMRMTSRRYSHQTSLPDNIEKGKDALDISSFAHNPARFSAEL